MWAEDIADIEPSFWGGTWIEQFAAHFTTHCKKQPQRNAREHEEQIRQALAGLSPVERGVIEDYYTLCLPRHEISVRRGVCEREVDTVRAKAERRLRGLLAGYVERRFGVKTPVDSTCIICHSPHHGQIDTILRRRRPRTAWGTLRRQLNDQFGLSIRRVQVLITHCRFHVSHATDKSGEES